MSAPSIRDIQIKSCEIWNVSLKQLLGKSRISSVKTARHCGIKFAYSIGYQVSQIAAQYLRVRSNVIYALGTPDELPHLEDVDRDKRLRQSFAVDPGTIQTRQAKADMLQRFKIA